MLDTDRRELRRGGNAIRVTPQAFDLLVYLIRHRQRVVSKDELVTAIWGRRFVSDSALTTRINAVRNAIGDRGTRRRLVETLPRKGLRFIGSVSELGTPDVRDFSSAPARPAMALLERPAIALLPFATASDEQRPEFFADSLVEEVLTALCGLRWLRVTARGARLGGGDDPANLRQTSVEPDVRYLLDGSVRRTERRVRVIVRLVDAATGTHLWAERYEPDLSNVAARDDITRAVALAVASAIDHAEQRRAAAKPPRDLDAWEAYQRGMWHMSHCDAEETRSARTFFQRAIDLDPRHAAAYGALAWSNMMAASIFSEMAIVEGCALSEPLVRQAIKLDNEDPEIRARLALIALLKGDLEDAVQESRQILSVKPDCAGALGVKGAALVYSGRREEGRQALQQYLGLSPRDPARPIRLSQIATSLYLDGDYEAAAAAAKQVVRHYPHHPIAYRWLAAALGQLDRGNEAMDALRTLQAISPSSFEMYVRQRPKYCGVEYAPMLEGLRKAGWRD